MSAQEIETKVQESLAEAGIFNATVEVTVTYQDPDNPSQPIFTTSIRLHGSVGGLTPQQQTNLHTVAQNAVSNAISEVGLSNINQGPIVISDQNGAVKPVSSLNTQNTPTLDESLNLLDQKVAEIKKIQQSLGNGMIPEGYGSREEAEQALQILLSEVNTILNDINTVLENTDSDDENPLALEDKAFIQESANLIGGHPITENPFVEIKSGTQESLEDAGFIMGEDFEILSETDQPNCHTYTLSQSGIPTTETVFQIDSALNQHFDPVTTLDTSNMTPNQLDEEIGNLGLQDGDVFVFTDERGNQHSGIVRIVDGQIRFESVLGGGNRAVGSPPSVTFGYYSEDSQVTKIEFYRKKEGNSV